MSRLWKFCRHTKNKYDNVNGFLTPSDPYSAVLEKINYNTIIKKTTTVSAFKGYAASQSFLYTNHIKGLKSIDNIYVKAVPYLEHLVKTQGAIKYQITIKGLFLKDGLKVEEYIKVKDDKSKTLHNATEVRQSVKDKLTYIKGIIEDYDGMQGSGWVFETIKQFDIHHVKYKPLNGSSYIETPKQTQI